MLIERNNYKKWLDEFREKRLVKVLTGLRRSGKSTILEMYMASLLKEGVDQSQIISMNFEQLEFAEFLNPLKLHEKILSSLVADRTTYVFLDEIQHVKEYEKVIDSLYVRKGLDLYITGSTADLLSSEIASRLTGRYVEINVLPLSFQEYAHAKKINEKNSRQLFMDYISYGGLPGALEFNDNSNAQREYIESVFKTIIEKDVLKSAGLGRFIVEQIIRYMTDNVGCLTSAKRLADRLAADSKNDKTSTASYNTVVSYLERLCDCFFFYKADRFDVRGGEHLKLINKYYLTDFGFKYYILHNPILELQQLVENIIYFELKRRRYKVSTGRVKDKEVDFVTQGNDGRIRYIQVAVTVANEEKLKQELAAFKLIKDNYPKYILTMDEVFVPDHNGVRTINIIDFLLGKKDLD
jgi:predicted AAA+ superfamily ATPase